MNRVIVAIMLVLSVVLSGCSGNWGSAGLGALGGAVVGAGGYEYQAHREMEKLEEDYRAGRIDRKEYESRKDQIRRGSLLQ
jgi:hypothetical protein